MNNHKTDSLKLKVVFRRMLGWLPLMAVMLSASPAAAQDVAMDKLENALLAEDWQEVADLLDGVTADVKKSPNPVLRLIKGHAQLVMNKNNDSVNLFLSVTTPNDLEKCRQWADDLLNHNGENAIAYYFLGDVESRLHNYEQAIRLFTMGLNKRNGHVLLHNARGVALAHVTDPKNATAVRLARGEFEAATSDPSVQLADAYANLGAYRIQRKDGADTALAAFNKALEISPDYALALHGRGCIRIIQRQMKEAKLDLEAARQNAKGAIGLLSHDLLNAAVMVGGIDEDGKKVLRLALKKEGVGATTTWDIQTLDDDNRSIGTITVQGNFGAGLDFPTTGNAFADQLLNNLAPEMSFDGGGILTTFERGVIDEGEWPFAPLYGLTLNTTTKDAIHFLDTKEKE
jgi:tetratricopeptide (TPR) repeat protein